MEITPQALAALVAAEVTKARSTEPRNEPRAVEQPIARTSIATYAPNGDEITIVFKRFTTVFVAGQLTAYQRGTSAGFPSTVALEIIRSGAGVKIGQERRDAAGAVGG